jgi:MFS family permease
MISSSVPIDRFKTSLHYVVTHYVVTQGALVRLNKKSQPRPAYAQPDQGLSDRRQFRLVLVGLMSIMLLAALDHTIVVTALPLIVNDLGSPGALTAVVTSYMLASALSSLWFGQVADVCGRRNTLLVSVVIFVAASALCGLAQNMAQLIVLRAVQGIGAGGFLTLAQTVIADLVPPRERGRYQGYVLSVFGAASVAGPFVGGTLADQVSWRAIFLVNVPVGVLALWLLKVSLRRGSFGTIGRRTSAVSSGSLGASAVFVLLAMTLLGEGRDAGVCALLGAIGLGLFAAFVVIERRVRHPLFASAAIRSRLYLSSNAAGFMVNGAMMGAVVLMPLYLQGVLGLSAAETGLAMLPQVIAWLAATLLCGHWISRTGAVKVFALFGSALNALGLLLLSRLDSGASLWLVGCFLCVFGVGQGLALQALTVASQADVTPEELGKATGLSSFSRSVGSVLGVAGSGVIVGILLASDQGLESTLQWTLLASVPVGVLGLVFSLVMPEVRFTGKVEAQAVH